MKLILANVPAIFFAACGAALCYLGKEGWGWFVFLAAISIHTISGKCEGAKEVQ